MGQVTKRYHSTSLTCADANVGCAASLALVRGSVGPNGKENGAFASKSTGGHGSSYACCARAISMGVNEDDVAEQPVNGSSGSGLMRTSVLLVAPPPHKA